MAMSEAGQDTARDLNAFAAGFFSGPMVDVVVRTTESCGKAYLAWHEEVLRFATARLQRDSELGQALANTRNWADAAKLQQEWAASAIRDYTNETTRLFEIAADAGSKITESSGPATAAAGRMASDAMRSTADAMRSAAETAGNVAEETRNETRGAEASRQRAARRATSTE
jgi:Phasin protein